MPEDYYDYQPDEVPQPPMPMPGQRSDQVYSAIIQEKRVDNILEQLNPENLIIEIEFRLKGYKKNQFNKSWELIGSREKEVSEELIQDFLSLLSSLLSYNTTLSNFSPDEINKIMKALIRGMIDIIREKSEIYKVVNDYAERDRIMLICLNTVFSALKRAQGGNESKRIFDSTTIRDQNIFPGQEKKGGLAKFFNI